MNSGLKIQTILPFIDEYRSGMAWATAWEIPNFHFESVWPESLGPKTPKWNLKTPKKNTTLKTRKHHFFGYKNTKYLIKSFKNGPPKHFHCIFVYQFLKNFNFFTEIFQKISIFSNF